MVYGYLTELVKRQSDTSLYQFDIIEEANARYAQVTHGPTGESVRLRVPLHVFRMPPHQIEDHLRGLVDRLVVMLRRKVGPRINQAFSLKEISHRPRQKVRMK